MVQDCESGMSQDVVARKYSVSQSSVSKYVLEARGRGERLEEDRALGTGRRSSTT